MMDLQPENYIDDIPFNTADIVSKNVFLLEEEAQIDDIPFNTGKVLAANQLGMPMPNEMKKIIQRQITFPLTTQKEGYYGHVVIHFLLTGKGKASVVYSWSDNAVLSEYVRQKLESIVFSNESWKGCYKASFVFLQG